MDKSKKLWISLIRVWPVYILLSLQGTIFYQEYQLQPALNFYRQLNKEVKRASISGRKNQSAIKLSREQLNVRKPKPSRVRRHNLLGNNKKRPAGADQSGRNATLRNLSKRAKFQGRKGKGKNTKGKRIRNKTADQSGSTKRKIKKD